MDTSHLLIWLSPASRRGQLDDPRLSLLAPSVFLVQSREYYRPISVHKGRRRSKIETQVLRLLIECVENLVADETLVLHFEAVRTIVFGII